MSIESAVARPLSVIPLRAVGRLSRWNRPHVLGVGALTAVIAAIFSVYTLVSYATYDESNYDLVIFDQAIRSYAHFHLGISIIKGLHDGFGPNFSVLGDHFSPLDIALAPLYWIYDGPQSLLVAQAVLFALAIPWLWVYTRRAMGGSGRKATAAAYLACVGYGLSWPLAAAVAFEYHEVAFVPVLTAIALERLQGGKLRGALIALGFLLLVKEDMGLLVAGIGFVLAVSFSPTVRRQRLVGIILIVVGVAYTYFATSVIIPAFGGRANYYWAYSALGQNIPQLLGHLIRHPGQFLQLMVSPHIKLRTWKWLLLAFCFLPLLSPLTLAALPLLIERMLAGPQYAHWWGTHYQYNAFVVAILVFASVDGAVRLDRWATRVWLYMESPRAAAGQTVPVEVAGAAVVAEAAGAGAAVAEAAGAGSVAVEAAGAGPVPAETAGAGSAPASGTSASVMGTGDDAAPAVASLETDRPLDPVRRIGTGVVAFACCAAICLAALYSVRDFALDGLLSARFYHMDPREKAIAAADAKVPSGVVVAAANFAGAELSSRDTVLMWDGDGYASAFAAPWVVADTWRLELGFSTIADERADVALLQRHGYRVVFFSRGLWVLHRPGPPNLSLRSRPLNLSPRSAG
jgi:uncharacterized membrane protein